MTAIKSREQRYRDESVVSSWLKPANEGPKPSSFDSEQWQLKNVITTSLLQRKYVRRGHLIQGMADNKRFHNSQKKVENNACNPLKVSSQIRSHH